MDLVKSFAIYVRENNIDVNWTNVNNVLNNYKEKLIAETETMEMQGFELSLGDWVQARYSGNGHLGGGTVEGIIKAFYPHIPMVKLDTGWCFHSSDEIILHRPPLKPQEFISGEAPQHS